MMTRLQDTPVKEPEEEEAAQLDNLHPTGDASTPPMPEAGDTDPDSTRSAEETGQDGADDRPGKDTGHAWNG